MLEQSVIAFIHSNAILLAGLYYLFSASVSNLPVPTDKSSTFYRWAYGTLHTLAGNLAEAGSILKRVAGPPSLPEKSTSITTDTVV